MSLMHQETIFMTEITQTVEEILTLNQKQVTCKLLMFTVPSPSPLMILGSVENGQMPSLLSDADPESG